MFALALFVAATTSACAVTMRNHAQVASVAADLLTAADKAIEAERVADVRQFRAETPADESPFVTERRMQKLQSNFAPIMQAYQEARTALFDYETAVTKAIAAGQDSLAAEPAAKLVSAWQKVAELGDSVGVAVPPPPPALIQMAGGSQ